MSLEENKAIVRKMVEEYNKANFDILDDLVAPEYIGRFSGPPHQLQGLESLKQLFKMGREGCPDWHETIEDIIAEGDKVWVRTTYTGTNTGEFFGLAPTGKKITTMAVDIYRIINGKIVEGWNIGDSSLLLKQLGIIEYTEKGKKLFPEDAK
jgi:predicted ester cyclase